MGFCKSRISWRTTLWTHFRSWQSYPYFFVFPLYCLLKIRNFPDIALLFLLQLLDFLRDRSKMRRQKVGNRLTKTVEIAAMPKNTKSGEVKGYLHAQYHNFSHLSSIYASPKATLLFASWFTKSDSSTAFLYISTKQLLRKQLISHRGHYNFR